MTMMRQGYCTNARRENKVRLAVCTNGSGRPTYCTMYNLHAYSMRAREWCSVWYTTTYIMAAVFSMLEKWCVAGRSVL